MIARQLNDIFGRKNDWANDISSRLVANYRFDMK